MKTQQKDVIEVGDIVSLKSNPQHLMVVDHIGASQNDPTKLNVICVKADNEGIIQRFTVSETSLMLRNDEVIKII